MSVDYTSFAAVFPEFATDDADEQARITTFIGFASAEVSQSKYGIYTDRAILWLAAHQLAIANRGSSGGSGAVVMEQISKLKVQYAAPSGDSVSNLDSTAYGQEFKRIQKMLRFTPAVTGRR